MVIFFFFKSEIVSLLWSCLNHQLISARQRENSSLYKFGASTANFALCFLKLLFYYLLIKCKFYFFEIIIINCYVGTPLSNVSPVFLVCYFCYHLFFKKKKEKEKKFNWAASGNLKFTWGLFVSQFIYSDIFSIHRIMASTLNYRSKWYGTRYIYIPGTP